jgi:hypothetical protein
MHAVSAPAAAAHHETAPDSMALHRAEIGHKIEALVDQEANYDIALAVHGKERSMLLQLVSYLVVSLALSFQVDLGSSTSQLAIIAIVIVGYMVSDIVTSILVSLLRLDSFSRPQMAVFIQFCVTTPLSFVGYVAVNIIRDNVIDSDTTPRLEVIIPISALLCFVYVEILFGDAKNDQVTDVYAELRRQQQRDAAASSAGV